MYKQKRKGFTLVELLVVIAILAVLATVSIVGYASFVKKAKISNDTALLKQINDLLIADEAVEGKPATMQDALDVIEENGFLIEKLTPTAQGYNYIWDRETNRFLLLDDKGNAFAPAGAVLNPANSFVIVHNEDEIASKWSGYNYYLAKDFKLDSGSTEFPVSFSVDAGKCENIKSIVYSTPADSDGQTVTIRTNGGKLTVNAPNDTVNHYGEASKVTIEAIKSESYHEYGNVTVAYIEVGHFVVDGNGHVDTLYVQPTGDQVRLTLKTNSVGTLKYKENSLTSDSVVPDTVWKEILTENVSSDKLNVVVGDKVYDNISDAIADITETGGTIDLIENLTVTKTEDSNTGDPVFTVKENTTLDLELNGNTVATQSTSGKDGIVVEQGATATISNGTISQNKAYGSGYAAVNVESSTLTLDNMTVALTTNDGTCVSAGSDGGTLNINNSTISGGYNTVFCGSGSSVVIENSTVIGSINVMVSGTVELKGGDYTQATFSISGKAIVYGGSFSQDPRSIKNTIIAADSVVTTDGDKWIVTPLSEFAPTNVDSATAFKAALQNSGSVKLTADIALDDGFIVTVPASVRVLLDLNGHVITENSKSVRNIEIAKKGTLIIQDTSVAKTGEIKNTFVGNPGEDGSWGLIGNDGTLIINGGKFTNVAHGYGSAITNRAGGTLTINGGTFVSDVDDSAARKEFDFDEEGYEYSYYIGAGNSLISNRGTLTITSGTFTMKNTVNAPAIEIYNWSSVTIENADISSKDSEAIKCLYGYLDINGGRISGKTAIYTGDEGYVTINGGEISGTDNAILAEWGDNVSINGGTVTGKTSANDGTEIGK